MKRETLKVHMVWKQHWNTWEGIFLKQGPLLAFLISKCCDPSENRISSILILDRKGRTFSSLCYKKVNHVTLGYTTAIFNRKCLPFVTNSMSSVLPLAWAGWKQKLGTETGWFGMPRMTNLIEQYVKNIRTLLSTMKIESHVNLRESCS